MTAEEALRRPGTSAEGIADEVGLERGESSLDLASLEVAVKYEGYLKREALAVERSRRNEGRRIPVSFEYAGVPGLSREVVQRLTEVRPEKLGQALRVPGVTPAAVSVLEAWLEKGYCGRAREKAGTAGGRDGAVGDGVARGPAGSASVRFSGEAGMEKR
ncbi:MAG: hypothetical protein EHM13_04245 [Acidobacteria bacterium]|nr:MAG: hypothetical protein EHM13_04245 [Acidobacteriota bacterium]